MSLIKFIEQLQTPYCERIGAGPLDEPLNAISNLAFAVAAILAAVHIHKRQVVGLFPRILPWSIGAVAVASTIYHTLRSPLTFVVDALSLSIFMVVAIFFVLRKITARTISAILLGTAFLSVEGVALFCVPEGFLNGSTPHVIALVFVVLLMGLISRRHESLARQVVPIAAFYAVAIVCRTIDMAICSWLPIGTHFLWHVAGAIAAFLTIRFALLIEAVGQQQQAAA